MKAPQSTMVSMAKRLLPSIAAAVSLCGAAASPAFAGASNMAVTHAYLLANYAFVRAAHAQDAKVEGVLHALSARITSECASAAKGSPQDPESEQLSNELIGDMVVTSNLVDPAAAHTYLAAVQRLHWKDAAVTAAVSAYTSKVRRLIALTPPHVCDDVHSWAASGFRTLAPATVAFAPLFMDVWVSPGDLPSALARYETPAERPLIARTRSLEDAIGELETREETTWWNTMGSLDLWP